MNNRYIQPDGVIIALDAEWSAYESYAAASILQISLDDVVSKIVVIIRISRVTIAFVEI